MRAPRESPCARCPCPAPRKNSIEPPSRLRRPRAARARAKRGQASPPARRAAAAGARERPRLPSADHMPFFARSSLKYSSSMLALHPLLELRLHLVERRHLGVADVVDLDHVPAELRLHRHRRELALRQLDHRVRERLHEVARRVPVEVAAVGLRARILRALGELLELARPSAAATMMSLASSSFSTRMWRTLYSLSPICALIASYSLLQRRRRRSGSP